MEVEHRVQLELLHALREVLARGDADRVASANLLRQVEDWLLTHMATTDKALESYLAENGPQPQ